MACSISSKPTFPTICQICIAIWASASLKKRHKGQVLRQGTVAELRARRQDRYRLLIQGNPAAFLEELRLEGVRILNDNGRGELRVAVPPGWVTRAFFALADNHQVALRGLVRDDEDLEELFYRVIGEGNGA